MSTQAAETQNRLDLLASAGVTIDCIFIPFNQSRNCKDAKASWWKEPNWPSLNWRVVVNVKGNPVLITDYSQGIAHIPGYKQSFGKSMSVYEAGVIAEALRTGSVPIHREPRVAKIGKIPAPGIEDVMYSLLLDGSPDFDAVSFENWASDYGYDNDSRKAERIYNTGVDIGRKLRDALGMETINNLREAFQDY